MNFNEREEKIGKNKVTFKENIIVPYLKDQPPKDLSKKFIKKIKSFDVNTAFTNKEWIIMSIFEGSLLEIIKDSLKTYNKKVFIVLPPSKRGKENHMKNLINSLSLKEVEIIEFVCNEYDLKQMNKEQRIELLDGTYKEWEINNQKITRGNPKKLFFIFVDDIVTTGATSFFVMKAIQEYLGSSEELYHRSFYLMGTKSSEEYTENKKYIKPDFWNNK